MIKWLLRKKTWGAAVVAVKLHTKEEMTNLLKTFEMGLFNLG